MKKISKIWCVVPFILLILLNIIFYIDNYKKSKEIDIYIDEMKELSKTNQILMDLVPTMKPMVKRDELFNVIKEKYKNEKINVSEDHIWWRSFQFWFSIEDKIIKITYGS